MKVLLINGSPKSNGCTFTALSEVSTTLNKEGISTEFFHIGSKPVYGCTACQKCRENKRCTFSDDLCNSLIESMANSDGIIIGSPVYYAGPNGALCALLDRAFYAGNSLVVGKPASAIVSCRRAGSTAALDRLNKYITINKMPYISSQYWNMVHGSKAEDVAKDEEGLQTMRVLGLNMAHFLKLQEGTSLPQTEPRLWTNFIR